MKIFVTGSNGRVGKALVNSLLEKNYSVVGMDLRPSTKKHPNFTEFVGDLDHTKPLQEALQGCDAVFHLAALMSWNENDRAKMFQVNVNGTENLIDAAVSVGVKKFIFASSGEVYPENKPEKLPIDENHPLNPNSYYGLTKLLGENIVRFFRASGKIETVILRFAHTQDADELLDETSFFSGPRFFLREKIKQQHELGNHDLAKWIEKFDPGHPAHILQANEEGRAFQMHITDTRDMIQGLLLALENPNAGGEILNLGMTDPVDFSSLIQKMSNLTGLPIVQVNFPGKGVYYHTSNSKIRNLLGYKPEWTIDRMLEQANQARTKNKNQ